MPNWKCEPRGLASNLTRRINEFYSWQISLCRLCVHNYRRQRIVHELYKQHSSSNSALGVCDSNFYVAQNAEGKSR
jgi:hypothetical protein